MTIREIDQQLHRLDTLEEKLMLDLDGIKHARTVLNRARVQLVKRTEDIDREGAKSVKEKPRL